MRKISIFAIADLHLSFGVDKPMDVFKGWDHHEERIRSHWEKLVKPEDTVILPGDFSWALKLEETKADFAFLDALPGQKILLKGNHDLWWSTKRKLTEFIAENEFNSIRFLYNESIVCEGYAVAGTRGWFYDAGADKKIIAREAGRLERSLTEAEKTGLPVLLFLHYPPVYGDTVCTEIFEVIKRHGIKEVYHGHIHGAGFHRATGEYDGVKLHLISCDCIDFTPFFVV